jgi:RNA polymerase sigma-70 factor, ECF subfamily
MSSRALARPIYDPMMNDDFAQLVAPYRRELQAHCYRMLGSLADAEDQVQETLLRAWRRIDGFEGRSSLRTWLYTIATNSCIDLLRSRPERTMPPERGAPGDPLAPLEAAAAEPPWIDPCPASWWEATPESPEARYSARESVQLAFVVALQHLPPAQRAVLLLREVLGWSAAEVAALLETSVASVNSALQRARATLDARRDRPDAATARPAAPERERLLRDYLSAWERSDIDALVALVRDDVVLSMPPRPAWFRGRSAVAAFFPPRLGPPGTHRVVPLATADDLTFAFYRRSEAGRYEAHGIQVARLADGLVAEIHAFLLPTLYRYFDLPPVLDDR